MKVIEESTHGAFFAADDFADGDAEPILAWSVWTGKLGEGLNVFRRLPLSIYTTPEGEEYQGSKTLEEAKRLAYRFFGWQDNQVRLRKQTLNDIMSFGHLIKVGENGFLDDYHIEDQVKFYAPESVDVEVDEDGQILDEHEKAMVEAQERAGWTFFTKGYSAQDRYAGPIMHSSEFIGGGLERDIREQPGYYVAVTVDTDEDTEDNCAGWAVLYRES